MSSCVFCLLFALANCFHIDYIYAPVSADVAFSPLACKVTTKRPRNRCGGKISNFQICQCFSASVFIFLYVFIVKQ